jgi:hypothetical protein
MNLPELLPYATSLGMLFVLVGFVLLIWSEGASHRFSTVAFLCFVVGIAMTGWTIYAQVNEPPTPATQIQGTTDTRTAAHIRECLQALKRSFTDEVKRLGLKCSTDSLGWPDQKCVEKSESGKALYAKLHSESEFCYRPEKK